MASRSSVELSGIGTGSQTTTVSEPDPNPSQEDIDRKPWKYIGYKGYASFIASDSDFYIVRRFDALSARVALALQDEVSDLEEKLSSLDQAYSQKNAPDVNNGTFRDDLDDRISILNAITTKLYRYNKFILQQSELRKFPKAPSRDVKSIRHWHYNHNDAAISNNEREYLDHEDELFCVAPKEKTPLRRLIDRSLTIRTLQLWRQTKDVPDYDANHVAYYSDKRMDSFASIIISAIGVTMLITPIWILQSMETLVRKLVVITVFILVFLLILSFAMASKPFEALGATAAYAAVLMVFIQVGE